MNSRLLTSVAAIGLSVLAFGSPAHATHSVNPFTPAPDNFLTLAQQSDVTFTLQGASAADFNRMVFAIDGTQILTNHDPLGNTNTFLKLGAGTHLVELIDQSTGDRWFPGVNDAANNPSNPDGEIHLVQTDLFSNFHLGSPVTPASLYYGWEDRPHPPADDDFNDLVFSVNITPVPEPASLALLGSALVGFGVMRRRRKTV